MPWLRLTNTYGPTEAAIGMIYHHFDGSETSDIPLGKPIPGTMTFIVDEELNPVSEGNIGQLVIGGYCLGAGYHNDLAKTNSVFKTLLINQCEFNVFLTGDRAVKYNDNIYFRGRADKQIKIKGVRVELKEIESSFEEHPDILQFRVIPVTGDHQVILFAFYTSQQLIDEKILRSFAADKLPKEFLPNKFVQIDSFETTSSGKIDRFQLKKLASIEATSKNQDSATKIQGILLDLTGIDFEYEDNLFDAGLDSLDAMRLVLEIEDVFSISTEASDLYQRPTIKGINEYLNGITDNTTKTCPDLSLWKDIQLSETASPISVLLTGATGYLGVHMLAQLTSIQMRNVLCLIRDTSETQAMLKLYNHALRFRLHKKIDWSNVEIVLGDMSLPKLGLHDSDKRSLSCRITSIYNVAADVNFIKPMAMLEQVNIRAVIELAELATAAGNCSLHHISSTAVLGPNPTQIDISADRILEVPQGGYGQSKLAAELALQSISKQKLPVSIYRIGELMPSVESSVPNSKSIVICYLRTLAHIGLYSTDVSYLDYCPVDATVSQILKHSADPFGIFGLANQSRVSLEEMMKCFSLPQREITPMSQVQVYEEIRQAASKKYAPDFVSITWAIISSIGPNGHWPILSYSKIPTCLKGYSGKWPTINQEYLYNSLKDTGELYASSNDSFNSSGFL